jgi:hypothetical protein
MFLLQLLSELTCFFYENMEQTLVSFCSRIVERWDLGLGFVAFRVSFLRLQVGWQGCWWYSSRSENYHRSVLIWSNCFSCVGCVVGAVFRPLLDVSYTHFWIHVHFCFEVDETGFGGCVRINFSLSACVSFVLEQSLSAHFVSESLFLLHCNQTIMRELERTNFLATIVSALLSPWPLFSGLHMILYIYFKDPKVLAIVGSASTESSWRKWCWQWEIGISEEDSQLVHNTMLLKKMSLRHRL